MDMTQGTIWKLLASFAFPLLLGNVFQQLYNTVDSYVVGNFVSKEALAAVGSVGNIINTLIGFFSGLAAGAGIVISQYFGAKDETMVQRAVQTSIIMTLVMCVLFTFLGIVCTPAMLRFMKMPADVWDDAKIYLEIYFAGASGLMLYNMGAGILQSVGDTRIPLIALIISAVTNVVLDLTFTLAFQMGVVGVALATIIAEAVSAMFVLFVLMKTKGPHRLVLRGIRFYPNVFKRIFAVGIPSALQMAITGFSNVFVQGYINVFGSDCMAGWSIYGKIDSFAMLPMNCIQTAATTFTGQNVGAGRDDRVKKALGTAILMNLIATVATGVPVVIFRHTLTAVFNSEPGVVYYGGVFLACITPCYLLGVVGNPYVAVMRGSGHTTVPTAIMVGSYVVFRQIYLFVLTRLTQSFLVIALAYPAGWLVCNTTMIIYYYFSDWRKRCLIVHPENPVLGKSKSLAESETAKQEVQTRA